LTTLAGYNALSQPMYINTPSGGWISFGYDPLGRCVKRWAGLSSDPATNPAAYFYYDSWNLIQEGQSAATVSRYYVHGAGVDEIVESSNATGQYAYHHYDARSHCILLTNTSGGILEQYDYDAFGLPHFYNATATYSTTSTFGNRFLFTGREWLGELHIYDYRNRLYQPELGRFMQPDPKEFDAGDYNLYRYCHNDPINKNDPWGLEPVKILLDNSGNWGDKGSGDYYNEKVTANNKPAEGVTKAELQRLTPNPDGSVSGNLFVDTPVKSIHNGKVDNKEQEHPNGWKDFARTLQDKVFLKFKDQTHSSPIEAAKAQAEYVQKLFKEEKRTQTIWDRPGGPHDYSRPENR